MNVYLWDDLNDICFIFNIDQSLPLFNFENNLQVQYTFIYDVLVESILAKKTRIREHEFTVILEKLKKVNQRTKTSKLDEQYLVMCRLLNISKKLKHPNK